MQQETANELGPFLTTVHFASRPGGESAIPNFARLQTAEQDKAVLDDLLNVLLGIQGQYIKAKPTDVRISLVCAAARGADSLVFRVRQPLWETATQTHTHTQ